MKKLSAPTKALFFLWLLILLSCLVIFRRFIFGDELAVFKDVGSDTLQQYLMHYNSIINSLRDGNLSLWDFTNGFGTSMYALNLFHPLLFLLYLAGTVTGPAHLPMLMVYFEILQIFLAATVMFFFLGEFKFSARTRVIGAYLYGFNGYLLVWGQHYQFGLFVILLPLLLLLAERAVRRKQFSFLLALAVSISVLSSVYMAYMTLLALGLYLLFRIFSMEESFKVRIKLFLMNCGSILLGLLMMMAVFLPSMLYLTNISSRMDASLSLIERFLGNMKPFGDAFYSTAFYRLFSSNLCGISDNYVGDVNYYEAPVLFIGILFVILFFQYLFTIHRQDASKKQKAAQYLAVALSCFFIFIQAGSMVFNAFVRAFSRHTFVFMPFAALLMAFSLEQIFSKRKINFPGLAVSAALFAVLFLTAPEAVQASPLFICLLGFLMIAVLLLGWQKRFALPSFLAPALLLMLVIVNMIYDSYHAYNERNTLQKSDAEYFEQLYGADVTEALDYLRENDETFYRVEKDYDAGSYCMDALAQNYFGVSTYNSAPNRYVARFIKKLWPGLERLSPSMFSYRQTVYDAELASLVNIKYLLSKNPALDVDGFSLKKQFGNLYVYQNQNTGSIGKFYTKIISEDKIPRNTSSIDMDSFLTDYLIVEDSGCGDAAVLKDYELKKVKYTIKGQHFAGTEELTIPIDREKLESYERIYADFTITFDSPAVAAVTLNNSCCRYISATEDKKKVHVRLRIPNRTCRTIHISSTAGAINGKISKIHFYGAPSIRTEHTRAEVQFPAPAKDTLVEGNVNNSVDGTLMVSIPYEDGWNAYIDGKTAKIHRADYGFMALGLPAGNHEIRLEYQAPGLQTGILLSLLGWSIFLILSALSPHGFCQVKRRAFQKKQQHADSQN